MYRILLYPLIIAVAVSGFMTGRWLELSGVLHEILESGGTAVGVPERMFREPPGRPPAEAEQEPSGKPDDSPAPTSPDTAPAPEPSPTPPGPAPLPDTSPLPPTPPGTPPSPDGTPPSTPTPSSPSPPNP